MNTYLDSSRVDVVEGCQGLVRAVGHVPPTFYCKLGFCGDK